MCRTLSRITSHCSSHSRSLPSIHPQHARPSTCSPASVRSMTRIRAFPARHDSTHLLAFPSSPPAPTMKHSEPAAAHHSNHNNSQHHNHSHKQQHNNSNGHHAAPHSPAANGVSKGERGEGQQQQQTAVELKVNGVAAHHTTSARSSPALLLPASPVLAPTPPISPQRSYPSHAVATSALSSSASSSCRSSASSNRPACCVCRVSTDEPLLHCTRCSLDVHAPCCGVDAAAAPALVASDSWQCRRCASGVAPNSVACFVCGQRSGCFSPTDDPAHPWVHILCGVWMPYLSWHNPDAMDKLTNVHSIPASLWGRECAVCGDSVGCCYACAWSGCDRAFHPTCAQDSGYEMLLDDREVSGLYVPVMYCSEHSAQHRDRTKEAGEERKEQEDSRASTAVRAASHALPSHTSPSTPLRSPKPRVAYRASPFVTPPPPVHATLQSALSALSSRPSPLGKRLFAHESAATDASPFATPQHSSWSSPSPSPSPSPSVSVLPSPSPSPYGSTVNSPSNATELDEEDKWTDRKTFHALVEQYFRPLTGLDMLRLGYVAPPPSYRSSQRDKERVKREFKREEAVRTHTTGNTSTAPFSASSSSSSSSFSISSSSAPPLPAAAPFSSPLHVRPPSATPSVHASASGLQRKFTSPHSSPVLQSTAGSDETIQALMLDQRQQPSASANSATVAISNLSASAVPAAVKREVADIALQTFPSSSSSSSSSTASSLFASNSSLSSTSSSHPFVTRYQSPVKRSSYSAISRLPPLPVVRPTRDPSFFVPPLSSTYRMYDESVDEELPRIPALIDLPHLSVLSGVNVPVLAANGSVQYVSTSDACLASPNGPVLVTDDRDAWFSGTHPINSSTSAPSTTSYLQVDPNAVLQVSLSPDIRINVLIRHHERDANGTAACHSALLDYQPIPRQPQHDGSASATSMDTSSSTSTFSSPYAAFAATNVTDSSAWLFQDAELKGFVSVVEQALEQEVRRAVEAREAAMSLHSKSSMLSTIAEDHVPAAIPMQSLDSAITSSDTATDQLAAATSTADSASSSADEPDDVLLELLTAQRDLQAQVEENVARRIALGSRIFYHDHITYRNELSKYHDNVQTTYRFAVAWQTFRHSLRKGMRDADIPKHLLMWQLNEMMKASAAKSTEASGKVEKKTDNTALVPSASQSVVTASGEDELDADEYVVCAVCFDSSSPEDNPVLYCDRCNLTVHKICYGLQSVPDGDFFCQHCEHLRDKMKQAKRNRQSSTAACASAAPSALVATPAASSSPASTPDTSSYPCVLCTHRGGALKPTSDGRWAHILCAMLVPRARLKDVRHMEPVAGVEDAFAAQRQHGRVCCVCRIDYGCCAGCSHKHCTTVFHAYCGWLAGFYYQADVNGIDIRFSIFCAQHTPDHALAKVKVPQLPATSSSPTPSPAASPVPQLLQTSGSTTVSLAPMGPTPFANLNGDSNSWVSAPSLNTFFPANTLTSSRAPPLPPNPATLASPVLQRQDSSGSVSPLFASAAAPSPGQSHSLLSYPREYLIELRLYQQRDIRNRAREDQRTRDTKKKKRRMEKRRFERSRALHEDLYQPGRCCVCFQTEAEVYDKKQAAAVLRAKERERDKLKPKEQREREKRRKKSPWLEIDSQAPLHAYPANRLLRCDQCQMDVHQRCYGITDEVLADMAAKRSALALERAEDGEDVETELASSGFLCHRCTLAVRDISCCVCPRKGGSFKPVDVVVLPTSAPPASIVPSLKWIHMTCAQWTDEVRFRDMAHLEGIEGVSAISKAKKRLRCCLCKRGGPCLPCSEPGCQQAMHATCAFFAGVFMQQYQRTRGKNEGAVRRLLYCPRHTPLHLNRYSEVPNSYTRLVKLRSQFDTARVLMDLIKRREKVKLALMQTEMEIEDERWRLAREKAREERLASVTALPSSDGKIRLRLSKPAATPTPTTTPSPLPWYKRDEHVDLTTSAAQSAEQLERTIQSMDDRAVEAQSDEAAGGDGKEEVKNAVRKSSRARRSSTLLDSSVISVITPKRRASRPNTPATTRRSSGSDETMEEMMLDGPLEVNAAAAEDSAPSTAVSTRNRPSSPRAKRLRILSSPRGSPSSSASASPTADREPALSPLVIPVTPSAQARRSHKRRSGQLNESEVSEPQSTVATPTLRQSKRHRLSVDTAAESERVAEQTNDSVTTSPSNTAAATAGGGTTVSPIAQAEPSVDRKTRGRKGKADTTAAEASSRNGIHSSPATPAATPRPAAGAGSVAASPSAAAASSSRFPLANVPPSSDDHQSAPFALNSVAEVQQSGRYYDATICAIQHTRYIALHAKSSNTPTEGSEPPTIPRGAEWNILEVSRRSVVRDGDEWCYYVHYNGWNRRFDEWVVATLVRTKQAGDEQPLQPPKADSSKAQAKAESKGKPAAAQTTAPAAAAAQAAAGTDKKTRGRPPREQPVTPEMDREDAVDRGSAISGKGRGKKVSTALRGRPRKSSAA